MAITALDVNTVRDYVSKLDDPNDPTTWKLRSLTSRDVARIRDGVTSFEVKNRKPGDPAPEDATTKTTIEKSKLTFEACRRGIVGWANFMGSDGQTIQFADMAREIDGKQRRVVQSELLDLIPIEVLEELADEIMGTGEVDKGEVGNSPGPSSED